MEIKQLEYFVAACDQGSFNKAAAYLYTTQPNVSKVISGLEKELGRELFVRDSRGIRLTPFGETIREYAGSILKNVGMIHSMVHLNPGQKLSISTYASSFLARQLFDFYEETRGNDVIEHFHGTVEEVTDRVKQGISEVGVVVLAQKQMAAFCHILEHKRLEFHHLGKRELCLFVGRRHPFYHRDKVNFDELSSVNALDQTDICSLGLCLSGEQYWIHNVKILPINGWEPALTVGYVSAEGQKLSAPAESFVRLLKDRIS